MSRECCGRRQHTQYILHNGDDDYDDDCDDDCDGDCDDCEGHLVISFMRVLMMILMILPNGVDWNYQAFLIGSNS